jgi:hypothetical protein
MNIFYRHKGDGIFWFRIFGSGLAIKDINKHPLLFSERNGFSKGVQIRKWRIDVLKKELRL